MSSFPSWHDWEQAITEREGIRDGGSQGKSHNRHQLDRHD